MIFNPEKSLSLRNVLWYYWRLIQQKKCRTFRKPLYIQHTSYAMYVTVSLTIRDGQNTPHISQTPIGGKKLDDVTKSNWYALSILNGTWKNFLAICEVKDSGGWKYVKQLYEQSRLLISKLKLWRARVVYLVYNN